MLSETTNSETSKPRKPFRDLEGSIITKMEERRTTIDKALAWRRKLPEDNC